MTVQRRLGQRSRREIDVEKVALKALCGDFEALSAGADQDARAREALRAARA
jgi:hypothetical protein